MNCSHCDTDTANIAFEETSHLDKRAICYTCIGKRDESRMKRTKSIILYRKDNRLVNYTHTLSFDILQEEEKGNCTILHFAVNSQKWKGVMYTQSCNQVACRKI
jgi:protein-arginine kinase activator protein McsA